MPKLGDRVGEYVLESLLGGGAFGEVWKAHHHSWVHPTVAVKIPRDPAYLRNLEREGALVERLDHPNIVKPISFDPYAPVPYLACEYVPGVNLREIIKQHPKPERAVAILQQVLAGLAHAHAQGVIHRDLKPENVLVHGSAMGNGELPPGSVRIADFGLGHWQSQSGESIVMSMDVVASTQNRVVGTVAYMAPEVQSGQPAGPQADLYACGVMLFELLTGDRPGVGDLPSHVAPNVPEYLDTVYRRACSRLELRFANVEQMVEAIKVPKPVQAPAKRSESGSASRGSQQTPLLSSPWPFDVATARRLQEEHAARVGAPTGVTNGVNISLVLIPPGEFMMGSPAKEEGRDDDEKRHRVKLTRGFYMGVTPVTQAQWQAVMGNNPSYFPGASTAATSPFWMGWLQRLFGGTERMEEMGWFADNSGTRRINSTAIWSAVGQNLDAYWKEVGPAEVSTHLVGQKKPNAWGLYDMHGNVWEWCADWYGDYPAGEVTDPTGPAGGEDRVLRGGSWGSIPAR